MLPQGQYTWLSIAIALTAYIRNCRLLIQSATTSLVENALYTTTMLHVHTLVIMLSELSFKVVMVVVGGGMYSVCTRYSQTENNIIILSKKI